MSEDRALAVTTDFFTPVVDDPYDYGAIAAANSLSDIYAMGGQPFLALNIAALPEDLPYSVSAEILRGGAEKAREAGVVIAGGHSVKDKEPKYGLVVLGWIDPRRMLIKGGVAAGDVLVLTKPLGFGVTTTALKHQQAEPADIDEAIKWMKTLNRRAAELAVEFELHGGTDITGFGLLGHSLEMAQASGLNFRIDYAKVPFLAGARKYAAARSFPGGAFDNREYFQGDVSFEPKLDSQSQMLLFDPQTSGGLLLSVPERKLEAFLRRASELEQPVWPIGQAATGTGILVASG